MNLPGIYRMEAHYPVGLWVTRDRRRYLVRLRLPNGGFITIAEYRTKFFARRLMRRSWRIAE